MRNERPRVATLDEVRVSRSGDDAIIEFVDSSISTTRLKLGPDVQRMSDQEILECFNRVVIAQRQMAAEHEFVPIEVPPGSPQIQYSEEADQWTPRGDVLRCLIDDQDGQAVLTIDDQELSIEEFGRLLTTYSGWGMRVVFVPDDEIEQPPRVEMREPDGDNR